ncbi:lysophospholipase D GDPD1 isoform X2 [Ahaetulla prasina]|uniref:lysophospholipase D GDPD1 isoform X2 n=1 Tax=Ahaetulla prasina TaxID=499056 RepID=UPI002648967E|nr:lysophospholipase D GDPD1 isoform X2 [Ahaetulla prasina]XP_058020067.1 lysophospholipase D GDPD1 isoform X2 [Ahaetulla prasina]
MSIYQTSNTQNSLRISASWKSLSRKQYFTRSGCEDVPGFFSRKLCPTEMGPTLEAWSFICRLGVRNPGLFLWGRLGSKHPKAAANNSPMSSAATKFCLCTSECQCEGEDRRIPLLQEVFEAFPHTPVNIDIKVNNDLLIKKVSELVSSYKREHLTVWGSVSHEVVEKCHKENCHIPILFCLRRVLLLLGLFYTGLLPFFPIMEDFLEIPMPSIILKLTLPTARSLIQIGLRMIPPSVLPRLKESEKISKGQRFTIWLIDILLMRKTLFDHLTARGIQVYIWVLNEDQEYKRAFDLGATGVMTDYPTKLKEFLHNYPA